MQTDNIISIAIEIDKEKRLEKISKKDSLNDIVNNICKTYNKGSSSTCALQFTHTADGRPCMDYVTEENRHKIHDAWVLKLVPSADYMAKWIFDSTIDKMEKLKFLLELSKDYTFVKELVKYEYHHMIPNYLIKSKNEELCFYIKTLKNVLLHKFLPHMDTNFVNYLIKNIKSDNIDIEILTNMLDLLGEIISAGSIYFKHIKDQLTVEDMFPFIWHSERPDLQLHALIIINKFVKYSDGNDKETLKEQLRLEKFKSAIFNNVLENVRREQRIGHELYIYQRNILSLYKKFLDVKTLYNEDNVIYRKVSNEVDLYSRRTTIIDFDETSKRLTLNSESSVEILRSDSVDNLFSDDIESCPVQPELVSQLTASSIEYYLRYFEKNFSMSILETNHPPGFYKICDQITDLLCRILHISENIKDKSDHFFPLLFNPNERQAFFEELFCRAVWLIARTRREMRAKAFEDHDKVLAVLEEQIRVTLNKKPRDFKSLTKLLRDISYKDIYDIWDTKKNEEWKKTMQHNTSIKELKMNFLPENENLIRQQRMNVLMKGDFFPKLPEKKGKQLNWFIYINKNLTKFYYGDWNIYTGEFISKKSDFGINDIKYIISGKACPHVKDNRVRRPDQFSKCFTVMLEDDASLDFLAKDELTAQYWVDALNLLIGKSVDSAIYKRDLEILLEMDLKLQLLDVQNIPLPQKAPPIPSLPPEFKFTPPVTPKSPISTRITLETQSDVTA